MDNYLNKVYLWLGIYKGTQSEFKAYFKLDYSVEGNFDDPNYKVCGFCKDIGENWYDEDFIGFLKYDEKVKIIDILDDVPVDEG